MYSTHALFMCGHYFVQYGFIKVCIFYRFFWKLVFLSFRSFLCFLIQCEFYNHCYVAVGVRCSVFLFWNILLKQMLRQMFECRSYLIKYKKELLSFWVLKIPLIRGCSSDIASSYFSVQVKSRSMLHHGSRNLTLSLTLNLLLLLPSIVFYDKICVFIIIFTALSFLRVIHGLFIIWGGNVS